MTEFSTDPSDHTEELVEVVPQEVRELLGDDVVRHLEQTVGYLQSLYELREVPEPFTKRLFEPADLSSLSEAEVEFVKKVLSEGVEPKTYSAPVMRQAQKISGVALKLYAGCRKGVLSTGDEIKQISKEMDAEIMNPPEEDQSFNASLVIDAINALHEAAIGLPSRETIQTVEALLKKARSLENQAKRKNPFRSARKLVSISAADTEQNIHNCKNLEGLAGATAKLGASTFALLGPKIKTEEAITAAKLLITVSHLRQQLAAEEPSSDVRHLAMAEQYLLDKAAHARSVIRNSTVMNTQVVKRALRNLSSKSVVEDVLEGERSRRLEEAKGLSVQLTEARDIILGGQRLKPNKAVPKPAEMAAQLDQLLSNGEKAFTERGLIIAILSGRFSRLQEVIDKLQAEEPDQVIKTLEEERSEAVALLREFGPKLPQSMAKLRDLSHTDPDQLAAIVGPAGVEKIINTTQKFFQAPGASKSNTEATNGSIEGMLPHSELVNHLDWTVLPKGELELEEAARAIVEIAKERVSRGAKVEIDLERLAILKNVRAAWNQRHGNKSHHFYARGTLDGRGSVNTNNGESPDEYIILVLQKKDENGQVVLEHAIAESPITRVNALYILRSDVAPGSWEEIFSLSKKEAREFGARGLHHTTGDGRSIVEVLTDRVNLLINCPPAEFFAIRFDGARTWLRKKLGQTAIG